MTTLETDNSPLCAGDLAACRRRSEQASGRHAQLLNHLLWVARHWPEHQDYLLQDLHVVPEGLVRPMVRPDETAYPCLAYLLTGDSSFAELGKQRLLELADSIDEREPSEWCQNHCWCDSFPVGRWIVFYDWIWDSGVFSEAEHERLRERLLYYLWAHPGQRLKARVLSGTPCNNQNGAMAFACAVGGYLFGIKEGKDPRAGRLLDLAMPHLVTFLTAFPQGGYSFEGSTYMGKVNALVLPLGLEAVRTITGHDLFDSRQDDGCASPREVFHAILRLTMPSGLVLPWDNYGYDLASYSPAAAYLASRTGSTEGLELLDRYGLVERPAHIAWGFDSLLWTLLYWPDAPLKPAGDELFSWAEPTLGGALSGEGANLFTFQMWDRSNYPPGRAQLNPNNLVVEYQGAPLLLDGRCVEQAKEEEFQAERFQYFKADTRKHLSFGAGTLGAHNCLFFDGQDAFVPRRETHGELLGYDRTGEAGVVVGDVTDVYRDGFDVTCVQRGTLPLGDRAILVRDRVRTASEHTVSWRAHLRTGELDVQGNRARLLTPDGAWLDACLPDSRTWQHRYFRDASDRKDRQLEGACHELTYNASGADLTLYTLLAPSSGLRPWHDLSAEWEWAFAEDKAEVVALLEEWPGGDVLDLRQGAWFYQTEEPRPGFGVFRQTFEIEDAIPAAVWLRLPRALRDVEIRVNGESFLIELKWEENPLLSHLLRVEAALQPGRNVLELVVHSTFDAAIRGDVELLCQAPAPAVSTLSVQDDNHVELSIAGENVAVTWEETSLVIEREGQPAIQLNPRRQPSAQSRLTSGPQPQEAIRAASEAVADSSPTHPRSADELARAIGWEEWREALLALEEAALQPSEATIEAAWELLQREVAEHETTFPREPNDRCWYRLKAAAAMVLGEARYEPATDLLGEIATGSDAYPARVASIRALEAIGTSQARSYLEQIPDYDEHNVRLATQEALVRW